MPFIFRKVVVESIGVIVDWIKGSPERKRRERQRKRNDSLEGRIEVWEGNLRSGLDEVRAAVAGEVEALREEQAKAMRHVERRLVRLEAGRSAQDGMERTPPTGAEPEPSKRRYVRPRTYPQLVTLEAEPDEDLVYGDATPVIVEWRRARTEFLKTLKTGTTLARTEVQEAREVAPFSELRDVQIHRPYTGIPRPGPIPVALGHPLRAAFSILSTDPR